MEYIRATIEDTEQIYELVQNTIKTVYPKYYPKEVVDFFCEHHSLDNIQKDINNGVVGILLDDGAVVGTGCYQDNHITRVYVLPEFQGRGCGSFVMQKLEDIIAETHDSVFLDASLPAAHLYEKRGYKTIRHDKWNVENDVVLVYEIMEKQFAKDSIPNILENGKIELHEQWQWLNGDKSNGSSLLEEK